MPFCRMLAPNSAAYIPNNAHSPIHSRYIRWTLFSHTFHGYRLEIRHKKAVQGGVVNLVQLLREVCGGRLIGIVQQHLELTLRSIPFCILLLLLH